MEKVCLNHFFISSLAASERAVHVYSYKLMAEGEEKWQKRSAVLYKLNTDAVLCKISIYTRTPVPEELLKGNVKGTHYELTYKGMKTIALNDSDELEALRLLEQKRLKNLLSKKYKDRLGKADGGGILLWDAEKTIASGDGWQVHSGYDIDTIVNLEGQLYLSIDIHHKFYSPWTLEQWLLERPNTEFNWLKNTYNEKTWYFSKVEGKKDPYGVYIPGSNISLAEYHLNLPDHPATLEEVKQARVVQVKHNKGKGEKETAHLSTRLRPSITSELISELSDEGDTSAASVLKKCRLGIDARFKKCEKMALWLASKVYGCSKTDDICKPRFVPMQHHKANKVLIARKSRVNNAAQCTEFGCFKSGETRFGCLDLTGGGSWPDNIRDVLTEIAQGSRVELELQTPKTDYPSDSSFKREEFWTDWYSEGIETVLVIAPKLPDSLFKRLRLDSLAAGITTQFTYLPDMNRHKAVNVVLGLLTKARWQTVSLEPIAHPSAAEIIIGFDSGFDRRYGLHFGTCAFASLSDGTALGWEFPSAQSGERLNSNMVERSISGVLRQFKVRYGRLPARVLLLRDGFVRIDEFEDAEEFLRRENVKLDLVEVRKSGGDRVAKIDRDSFINPESGTMPKARFAPVYDEFDPKAFRLLSFISTTGGSPRPLQVRHNLGTTPLDIIAEQVYRLTLLNPGSGFAGSRLPNVLHFADKMAKFVGRMGDVGVLTGLDRSKIFFC